MKVIDVGAGSPITARKSTAAKRRDLKIDWAIEIATTQTKSPFGD
jgi:hypothetical protein